MFGIDDAITAVANAADTTIKRIWPDATEIEKAKMAALSQEIQNQYNLMLAQLDINKEEAKNPSLFVAGARPAVMWVGVLTMAYSGLGVAVLGWFAELYGWLAPPTVDTEAANNILMGLLGLGAMRTTEKLKGVHTSKVGK